MKYPKLKIVIEPDGILHQVAKEVQNIDEETLDQISQMCQLMTTLSGIGLAANQVGLLKRMLVVDAKTIAMEDKMPQPTDDYLVLINPKIIKVSKETCIKEEGCLSLPTLFYNIERPSEITVEYTDIKGGKNLLNASGLLARCIEHEIDHLDGKIILDYISPLKKSLAVKKLKKIKG